jgi:hypothetical protein
MQGSLGKPRILSSPLFVFDTQPLAKPPARMLLHGSITYQEIKQDMWEKSQFDPGRPKPSDCHAPGEAKVPNPSPRFKQRP